MLINCKENSQLVALSPGPLLSWKDRLAMRIHLMLCKNCARFARQMALIRAWLRTEDEKGQLSDAARARIRARLDDAGQKSEGQ
jgi:anti-sigma factor ChrR (cupin superfamily)